MLDPDEAISSDLVEAHAKIDATRKALQAALDAQGGDLEPLRQAIARLEQIAAGLDRVGEMMADQTAAGHAVRG